VLIRLRSARTFQVWAYTVSHSQLLLRSNRTAEFDTRVEVLFKGVGAVQLPTVLSGLEVSEIPMEHAPGELRTLLTDEDWIGRKLYMIRSGGSTGYVVAIAAFFAEDHGEYYAPSSLYETAAL